MSRHALCVVAVLGLVLGGSIYTVLAATLESEVSWIGKLPGVSAAASEEKASNFECVYTVNGDVVSTMSSIRKGLQERDWKATNSGSVTTAGAAAQGVVATKGGMKLDLAVHGVAAFSTIALQLTSAAPSGAPRSTAGSPGPSTPSPIKAGQEVLINTSGESKTYECAGTEVIVNGSDDTIQLQPLPELACQPARTPLPRTM